MEATIGSDHERGLTWTIISVQNETRVAVCVNLLENRGVDEKKTSLAASNFLLPPNRFSSIRALNSRYHLMI